MGGRSPRLATTDRKRTLLVSVIEQRQRAAFGVEQLPSPPRRKVQELVEVGEGRQAAIDLAEHV